MSNISSTLPFFFFFTFLFHPFDKVHIYSKYFEVKMRGRTYWGSKEGSKTLRFSYLDWRNKTSPTNAAHCLGELRCGSSSMWCPRRRQPQQPQLLGKKISLAQCCWTTMAKQTNKKPLTLKEFRQHTHLLIRD